MIAELDTNAVIAIVGAISFAVGGGINYVGKKAIEAVSSWRTMTREQNKADRQATDEPLKLLLDRLSAQNEKLQEALLNQQKEVTKAILTAREQHAECEKNRAADNARHDEQRLHLEERIKQLEGRP